MEHSDAKIQQNKFMCLANVVEDKLLLEINDNITYKGQIQCSPYYNLNDIKIILQRGDIEIVSKTSSKMIIKLGFLTIQLQSEQNLQIQQLKKKVQQLEDKVKASSQWIEEDLNSVEKFDLNSIYKITVSGTSYVCSYHTGDTLTFIHNNGHPWTTSYNNRKANTGFGTVTKMMKQKCESS